MQTGKNSMDKFVVVLDEQSKEKLLSLGYHILQEYELIDKKLYVFENDINKDFSICNFTRTNCFFSNTLFF